MDNTQNIKQRTGAEKFVDHLMLIYDDSLNASNPSWYAGRKMFDNKWGYKDKDITGFKKELTDKGQKEGITRHVLGHAGVLLAGRGFGDKFDIIPGKRSLGELAAYAISGIAQLDDVRQKFFGDKSHQGGEADVEILNDYVGRDVANAFTRSYRGKYNRGQLKRQLFNLLGH